MEDLLIAILQGLFEFILEVFSYLFCGSWPFPNSWPESLIGRCILWFAIGCGLAALSMFFLNHTWIRLSVLRIANLILAPLTSAMISRAIAQRRKKSDESIVPRNHFWQAFWFTAGIVTVRFAYAARN
jgi:hypothetical protein